MVTDDNEQLCEVGDVLYKVYKDRVKKIIIMKVKQLPHFVYIDDYGTSYFNRAIRKSCYKTFEEASLAADKNVNIAKKRELLKEYEREINKTFNLENHYIIK